ncbi:hypothetical protein [Streptomyces shenzhenensis]|uniref:hypothetical protein n=1 Tax=Streptomyces shenzhenensis TaxID=943815 RepID=UPI0033D425D1
MRPPPRPRPVDGRAAVPDHRPGRAVGVQQRLQLRGGTVAFVLCEALREALETSLPQGLLTDADQLGRYAVVRVQSGKVGRGPVQPRR